MSAFRATLALASAFALQGCVVAAAAIPVLAGGAVVANGAFGDRTRQAIVEGRHSPFEDSGIGARESFIVLQSNELPAPVLAGSVYQKLLDHALAAMSAVNTAGSGRIGSALLADPLELRPERATCTSNPPAIIIDLDPTGGVMRLEGEAQIDRQLVSVLNILRSLDITIAWMTDREPSDSARIREILRDSGLDPVGSDPLFVQRFPGEQKQARRRALIETHCPIAIAGDTHDDFEEVFNHLRHPNSAYRLDSMISAGWFIIPNPVH